MPIRHRFGKARHGRYWLTYLVTIGAVVWLLSRPTFVAALLGQARILPFLLALILIPVLQLAQSLALFDATDR